MTTSARDPVTQLSCIGGNGCVYASRISAVQCQNEGQDVDGNIFWKCFAALPPLVELLTASVSCEGCTSSMDVFKQRGSCQLEYQLNVMHSSLDGLETSAISGSIISGFERIIDNIVSGLGRVTEFVLGIVRGVGNFVMGIVHGIEDVVMGIVHAIEGVVGIVLWESCGGLRTL